MGYLSDKKCEHEAACEAAIRAGDAPTARMHAAKAAEFCFALAKQTSGPVSSSYVTTAEGWLEIAPRREVRAPSRHLGTRQRRVLLVEQSVRQSRMTSHRREIPLRFPRFLKSPLTTSPA